MICYPFQPSRIINGKRVKSRLFYGRLQLQKGDKLETIPLGVTDRRVADQKLNSIVKERQLVAAGLALPEDQRRAGWKKLSELVAAFLDDLRGKGRAKATVRRYRILLGTLFIQVRWQNLRDVNARSFCEWRSRAGLKPHYANDILAITVMFLNWVERHGFVGTSWAERVRLHWRQCVAACWQSSE